VYSYVYVKCGYAIHRKIFGVSERRIVYIVTKKNIFVTFFFFFVKTLCLCVCVTLRVYIERESRLIDRDLLD
jgi:hypothetical protein